MFVCYLVEHGSLYLSSHICILLQYKKKIEEFNSLYFSLGSWAFSGSMKIMNSAKVSSYQIEGGLKICLIQVVYKALRYLILGEFFIY
jgi:hypothetical protein